MFSATMINVNPARYVLKKAEQGKTFFNRNTGSLAIGDENQNPITKFEFASVDVYKDGFVSVIKANGGQALLDIDGKVVLPAYGSYRKCPTNGYLTLYRPSKDHTEADILGDIWRDPNSAQPKNGITCLERGIANRNQEVLIDPKVNTFLQIIGDIVLYGKWSPVSVEYNALGVGTLTESKVIEVLPCAYNYVEFLGKRMVGIGRFSVTQTTTKASLFKNSTTTQGRLAFQLYDVDRGPVNDMVFGSIHRTREGNFKALLYPNIRPADLAYRQTFSEIMHDGGQLNFSGEKTVVLNERFELVP